MHNSASAPTLFYATSHRPLQVQPHSELVERFSLHPIISMPEDEANSPASMRKPAQNLASSAPAPPEFESQDTRASFSRQEVRPAEHSATSADSQHWHSSNTHGKNGEASCLSSEPVPARVWACLPASTWHCANPHFSFLKRRKPLLHTRRAL